MKKTLIGLIAGVGILALGYRSILNDSSRLTSVDSNSAYASIQPVSYGNHTYNSDGSQGIEIYSGPCDPLLYPFLATDRDGDGLADRLQIPQGELSRIVESDYNPPRTHCLFDDSDQALGYAREAKKY